MRQSAVALLGFLFVLAEFQLARGAEPNLQVLGEAHEGTPAHEILQQYLLNELQPHFEARRQEVKAIQSPEQFSARQERVRQELERINGPFPERTPLNARVTGRVERDEYWIEKVIYESRPGHHVTANFYLPKDATGKIPGVLIPCGHSANGKAAEPYQSIAISLACNGMAALVYDPIGQGERHQILGTDGKPLATGTTEHTLTGVGGWLVGTGTANYRIWDGIRSLDYLASRPEVAPERLGCTGNSGGGTLTSYLMAFDLRIKAAAPSCYLTTLERLFETIGPQDAEQNFPGQVALGIEHADYIALRAPLPTLMCVATQDYFDIDGAWTTFREAKQIYGLLGHSERMEIIEYDDKHGFSQPRRQAAMRFLRRWLLGKDDNPDEPEPLHISSDAELQCTESGEVLLEFEDGTSVFEFNRRRAESLAPQRVALWKQPDQGLAEVRRLTGVREEIGTPEAISRGTEPLGELGRVEKLILVPEPGMPLPALLFTPAEAEGPVPAVIYVSSQGKDAAAGMDGPIAALLREGKAVLSLDVRGFGETAAGVRRNRDGYFGTDFGTALLALHLNRPLLGQRVEDVIAAINWLEERDGVRSDQIELVGVGHAGPVALHAAALDDRIRRVTLDRSIESWMDVVREPLGKNQLTNVVPFALEFYDLPNLVQAIEPRQVVVRTPVDPAGEPKTAEETAQAEPPRGYSIPLIDLNDHEHRQVVVDRERGQYLGHPTTVLLEDGRTILTVYPKGHGRGAIVLKRSTDGGRTWSDRLPVPENWATSQETPTIHRVVDPEGKKRLIVFSGLYPVRMAVSEDDGHTWTPLEPVGDWGGIVAMGSVEPLRTGAGHYLALFHDDGRFFRENGRKSPTMTLYQTLSRDGGLTWSEPEAIYANDAIHLCEPGLIRSPDGRQMAVLLRENRRVRNSFIMFSNDEGRTWTEPRELPGALTGDRHTGKYAPDGRLLISFRDMAHESPTKGDWVGWVGTYDDLVRGREGQYRVRLKDNHKGADCAYPGVEVLPDGSFVTTTYGHWVEGEAPFVLSVRFALAELDALANSTR